MSGCDGFREEGVTFVPGSDRLYQAATKPEAQKKLEDITKAPEDIAGLLSQCRLNIVLAVGIGILS